MRTQSFQDPGPLSGPVQATSIKADTAAAVRTPVMMGESTGPLPHRKAREHHAGPLHGRHLLGECRHLYNAASGMGLGMEDSHLSKNKSTTQHPTSWTRKPLHAAAARSPSPGWTRYMPASSVCSSSWPTSPLVDPGETMPHHRTSHLSWLDLAQVCIFALFVILAHHVLS